MLVRPGAPRWLWYALTGRLAPRYREWAFYDLTTRTWPLRHLARLLVPLVPAVAALFGVLPGAYWVRAMAVGAGAVIGLLYSYVFLYESTDRRAVKLGYPSGAVEAARRQRRADEALYRSFERFNRDTRDR